MSCCWMCFFIFDNLQKIKQHGRGVSTEREKGDNQKLDIQQIKAFRMYFYLKSGRNEEGL